MIVDTLRIQKRNLHRVFHEFIADFWNFATKFPSDEGSIHSDARNGPGKREVGDVASFARCLCFAAENGVVSVLPRNSAIHLVDHAERVGQVTLADQSSRTFHAGDTRPDYILFLIPGYSRPEKMAPVSTIAPTMATAKVTADGPFTIFEVDRVANPEA